MTLRSSEVTDRARDQAKKAWKFINAAGKSNKVKGTVATIPTDVSCMMFSSSLSLISRMQSS